MSSKLPQTTTAIVGGTAFLSLLSLLNNGAYKMFALKPGK